MDDKVRRATATAIAFRLREARNDVELLTLLAQHLDEFHLMDAASWIRLIRDALLKQTTQPAGAPFA